MGPSVTLVGETEYSHAVQAQPAGAVIAIVPVAESGPRAMLEGDIESVQVTPACVTVTVWPAIVTVPVRAVVPGFAAMP